MRVLIQNRLEQFDGSLIFFSGKQVLWVMVLWDMEPLETELAEAELQEVVLQEAAMVRKGMKLMVQYPSSSNSGIMETVSKRTYCFEPGK